MKRGAIPQRMLVVLVLTLTAIVLFVVFGQQLFERGRSFVSSAQCEESIARSLQLRIKSVSIPSRITCPTEVLEFEGTEEQVTQNVLYAAYGCWKRWREGKEQLFTDTGIFCDICTVFEAEVKGRSIPGLLASLARYSTPTKASYLDYFIGSPTSPEQQKNILSFEKQVNAKLNTGQSWAVVFTYQKVGGKPSSRYYLEISTGSVPGVGIISRGNGSIDTGYYLATSSHEGWSSALYVVPHTSSFIKDVLGCEVFPSSQALPDTA